MHLEDARLGQHGWRIGWGDFADQLTRACQGSVGPNKFYNRVSTSAKPVFSPIEMADPIE